MTGLKRHISVMDRAWVRSKWIGRVLRSIATGAEGSRAYPVRAIEILWNRLPAAVQSTTVMRAAGRLIHRHVRTVQQRGNANYSANYTRFFRNLPQLELLRDLMREIPRGIPVKVAVLGCSTGAELYSAVWMIRTARPEQEVQAVGIDISEMCIQTAANGVYPIQMAEVAGISETSYERLFCRQGDTLRVREWLKEGVRWWTGDVCSSDLVAHFGPQDVVFANNFLFHMDAKRAERCLREVTRLVAPEGYLFVSGVDLDVRSRAVREMGLMPVTARLEDIYTAEEGMLTAWPFRFWGLEPMDQRRQDWAPRYATVFRMPADVRRALARNRENTGPCS